MMGNRLWESCWSSQHGSYARKNSMRGIHTFSILHRQSGYGRRSTRWLSRSPMTYDPSSQAVRAAAHQAALIGGPDGQNGSWGDGAHPSVTVAATARVILDSGMVTNSRMATITVMCARKPCRRYDPITVRITYQDAIWAPIGPFQLVKV